MGIGFVYPRHFWGGVCTNCELVIKRYGRSRECPFKNVGVAINMQLSHQEMVANNIVEDCRSPGIQFGAIGNLNGWIAATRYLPTTMTRTAEGGDALTVIPLSQYGNVRPARVTKASKQAGSIPALTNGHWENIHSNMDFGWAHLGFRG